MSPVRSTFPSPRGAPVFRCHAACNCHPPMIRQFVSTGFIGGGGDAYCSRVIEPGDGSTDYRSSARIDHTSGDSSASVLSGQQASKAESKHPKANHYVAVYRKEASTTDDT